VGTDTNWASVSAGGSHSLAIKTDGTLWAVGFRTSGQCGIFFVASISSPVQIRTAENWNSVGGKVGVYNTSAGLKLLTTQNPVS
jgi:alpha-tubulin suppressor-like RCC1 family protein